MRPKIVLVGVGRFGMNHLRVLLELEKEGLCTFWGVVDTRLKVLENIAKDYSIKTSTNLDEVLNDVDAVDIVTPTNTHFEIGKKCLNKHKHVFLEKPLTSTYNEAKKLVEISKKQNKTLMVGHIFRYNSAVNKIKELVENGDLGEIFHLSGHFDGLKVPRSDAGALFTYSVHHIDIFNYLLNKTPEQVTCCITQPLRRNNLEDIAVTILNYSTDLLGVIEGSWLAPEKRRDLTLIGSKRSITSDLLKQNLRLHNSHIKNKDGQLQVINQGAEEIKLDFKEPLKLELLDFIECIKTGKNPKADGLAGLQAVKVMENALESARLRRTVRLKPE